MVWTRKNNNDWLERSPVGPGWMGMVRAIVSLANAERANIVWVGVNSGFLSVSYTGSQIGKLDKASTILEIMSSTMCEVCGAERPAMGLGPRGTLCKECYEAKKPTRKERTSKHGSRARKRSMAR